MVQSRALVCVVVGGAIMRGSETGLWQLLSHELRQCLLLRLLRVLTRDCRRLLLRALVRVRLDDLLCHIVLELLTALLDPVLHEDVGSRVAALRLAAGCDQLLGAD